MEVLADAALFEFADLENLLFESFALGDVAHEAGEQALVAEAYFAHGQVHREIRAVFAPAERFAANADDFRLSRAQVIGEVAVVLLAVGGGHEEGHVLANHVGRRVAEGALGRRIERLDDAAPVDRDDGLDGGVENRAQARFTLAPGFRVGRFPAPGIQIRFQRRQPFDELVARPAGVVVHRGHSTGSRSQLELLKLGFGA